MTVRLTCIVLMITALCALSGCGGSGDGSRPGDNGVFYGGIYGNESEIVPGLTYLSEPSKMVGFTSSNSAYTFIGGDYVTFSINGFALPMIEASPVVSALSYGTPGVPDVVTRNVATLFSMLDTDSDTPGIQLPDTNFAAVVPPDGMSVDEFLETPLDEDFRDMVNAMFFDGTYVPGTDVLWLQVNVSGLVGGPLILQNNGGDNLSISANGITSFPTQVEDGFPYSVTVHTRPAGQGVSFPSGSSGWVRDDGVVGGVADDGVADVVVDVLCETGFIVGGTVSNFTGSREYPNLVLRNTSNGETVVVTGDGENVYYEFTQTLYPDDPYDIVIDTIEPEENAVFSNGNQTGSIDASDITTINIDCPGRIMLEPRTTEDNISPDGYNIGNVTDGSKSSSVAIDDSGNAIVVWTQIDGTSGKILMSTLASGGTWEEPESIASDAISTQATYAISPRVDMDNEGNALVIWIQPGGPNLTNQIFMSTYIDDAWDHPSDLTDTFQDFGTATINELVLGVNDNGTDTSYATIAWTQDVPGPSTIEGDDRDVFVITGTKPFGTGTTWTWSGIQRINLPNDSYSADVFVAPNQEAQSPKSSRAQSLDLSVNNSGQSILVWEELAFHGDDLTRRIEDSDYYFYPEECLEGIFKATYNVESAGWTFPSTFTNEVAPEYLLDPNTGGCISFQYLEARTPVCTIDDNGEIIVLWRQFTTADPSIDDGYFRPIKMEYRSGSWGLAEWAGSGYAVHKIDVASDDAGNAIVAWAEDTTPVFEGNIQILRWEYRGGQWSVGSTGEISEASTESSGPVVAMSNDNPVSAVIIWQQNNGASNQLYLAECRGGVWDDPEDLTDSFSPPGTATEKDSESVVMNDNGDTIIIWTQDDGAGDKQLFMAEYK